MSNSRYLQWKGFSRQKNGLNYPAANSSWCWHHQISYYWSNLIFLPWPSHWYPRQNGGRLASRFLWQREKTNSLRDFHHFERRQSSHIVASSLLLKIKDICFQDRTTDLLLSLPAYYETHTTALQQKPSAIYAVSPVLVSKPPPSPSQDYSPFHLV